MNYLKQNKFSYNTAVYKNVVALLLLGYDYLTQQIIIINIVFAYFVLIVICEYLSTKTNEHKKYEAWAFKSIELKFDHNLHYKNSFI